LITHPTHPTTSLNYKELLKLSENNFLWLEQTGLTYLLGYQTDDCFNKIINQLPNVFYSSDIEQKTQIGLKDWLLKTRKWFTRFNVSPGRSEELRKTNPLKILMEKQQ